MQSIDLLTSSVRCWLEAIVWNNVKRNVNMCGIFKREKPKSLMYVQIEWNESEITYLLNKLLTILNIEGDCLFGWNLIWNSCAHFMHEEYIYIDLFNLSIWNMNVLVFVRGGIDSLRISKFVFRSRGIHVETDRQSVRLFVRGFSCALLHFTAVIWNRLDSTAFNSCLLQQYYLNVHRCAPMKYCRHL